MKTPDSVVAVFADHLMAEAAIKKLIEVGFATTALSVVGKGYHSEEKVVGLYNADDRVRFWGARGAFWGAMWGLFFGGLFVTAPAVGPVIVLGYLATIAVSAVEGAIVAGGLSAIGAALSGIGIPKESVIQYEFAVRSDGFLVMVHGDGIEIARARTVLRATSAARVDVHAPAPAPALAFDAAGA